MSTYTPDRWVLLEVKTPEETIIKILAAWYGGFAGSNSWKINSGIESVKIEDGGYDAMGYSGSNYILSKGSYGTSMLSGSVYAQLEDQLKTMGEGYGLRMIDEEDVENVLKNIG